MGSVPPVLLPVWKWLSGLLLNPVVVGWTSFFSVSYVRICTYIRLSPDCRGCRFENCRVGGVRLPAGSRGWERRHWSLLWACGVCEVVSVRLTSHSCHVWGSATAKGPLLSVITFVDRIVSRLVFFKRWPCLIPQGFHFLLHSIADVSPFFLS